MPLHWSLSLPLSAEGVQLRNTYSIEAVLALGRVPIIYFKKKKWDTLCESKIRWLNLLQLSVSYLTQTAMQMQQPQMGTGLGGAAALLEEHLTGLQESNGYCHHPVISGWVNEQLNVFASCLSPVPSPKKARNARFSFIVLSSLPLSLLHLFCGAQTNHWAAAAANTTTVSSTQD